MHAFGVARLLGIRRVICPPAAGVASAIGMLVAPPMVEFSRSYVSRLEEINWAHVHDFFGELKQRALRVLTKSGVAEADVGFTYNVEMRYVGQGYEVPVRIPGRLIDHPDPTEIRGLFEEAYRQYFGQSLEGFRIETISWRLQAEASRAVSNLQFSWLCQGLGTVAFVKGRRPIYLADRRGFHEVEVYDRYCLPAGIELQGPAVIEERESTLFVGPDSTIRVDHCGNVVVDLR